MNGRPLRHNVRRHRYEGNHTKELKNDRIATRTEGSALPTQEEELEARRILLAAARTGDRKAKTELLESYGVKIYSEAERKKTKVVPLPTVTKQKAFERSRARSPSLLTTFQQFPEGQQEVLINFQ